MITQIASDIIEAAKSDKSFDKINAKSIADEYGVHWLRVISEIKYLRDCFTKITIKGF